LKTEPIVGKISKYKSNWIQHVNKDRLPLLTIDDLLKRLMEDWSQNGWTV